MSIQHIMWKSLWASSPQVGMREVVRVGLVVPGLGRLKPDTNQIESQWPPVLLLFNFPLISNIIYIPSLGVKVQSDAHYSSKR